MVNLLFTLCISTIFPLIYAVTHCIDYWDKNIAGFSNRSTLYLPCYTDITALEGVHGQELVKSIASTIQCVGMEDFGDVKVNSEQKYFGATEGQHSVLKFCAEESQDEDRLVLYEIELKYSNASVLLELRRSFPKEEDDVSIGRSPVAAPTSALKASHSESGGPEKGAIVFFCQAEEALSVGRLSDEILKYGHNAIVLAFRPSRTHSASMGGRPTKLRRICQKVIMPKVPRRTHQRRGYHQIDPDIEYENTGTKIIIEMDDNEGTDDDWVISEIKSMKSDFKNRLEVVRQTLNDLEQDHNSKLDHCANITRKINRRVSSGLPSIQGDPKLEECRLRNSLIQEKLKHCKEYLLNYDAILKHEKDDLGDNNDIFVRKLLLKTAKKHTKKSRLNEAIETFYQLITATNGQLCGEEIWTLFEICEQKCEQTFEFFHRLSNAVKTLECDNSGYIMNDLWVSVVEDLRSECSEMFDLTIKIVVEVAEPLNESCLVEKLKYLLAAKISALWLEMTSIEHDEFDDVKDIFFDSLNKCIDAFLALRSADEDSMRATNALNYSIRQFHTRYTTIAESKRLKKAMEKASMILSTFDFDFVNILT
uniref:Protein kinase domain-containing protein n=1 Tax=Bursaphelenchus xylophilus TaxID=6326 RepID=A0A1I7S3N3_BURXY